MRDILSKEFICSDYKLKQFNDFGILRNIPNPFSQKKVKRYKVEITEIEEDYNMEIVDTIVAAKSKLIENYNTFSGFNTNYFDTLFAEHLYKESDLSNLKYFFIRANSDFFNRRILYEFLKEQGLSIHKDYLILGSTPEMSILIFLKDQDTYNQIKLSFSNDTKISTLWELGL